MSAALTAVAERMVEPVGDDHEATSSKRDDHLLPVKRKTISKESTEKDQGHTETGQSQTRLPLMSAVAKSQGHDSDERHTNG